MSVAAVALAASGVAVLFAGPASAASGPKGKVTCTSMSGSVSSGFITISGCTGSSVPGTGGHSMPISIAVLANGGNVTWANSTVTHFTKPTLASKKATHCPGYVKSTPKAPYSGPEPSLETFAGQVTSDNSGLKVPGKYKGEVCISSGGSFSAPKAFKLS
jgi:hypothetical protein